MLLPSKIVKYEESVLSKLPILIKIIEKKDISVNALFKKSKVYFDEPLEFIYALDILYCLDKIEIDKKEGKILLVKENLL